ncbi:MAG: hypothetical protein HY859_02555 [Caulobacterales bacterium]|nr:hypothetical protein [Caulobacterales bacterium]
MRDRSVGTNGGALAILAFLAAISASVGWAWLHRGDEFLRAERGPGYFIGIAGALMMVALLGYPLRKRLKVMRGWGAASAWFRWHMILGVLGPALVVIHSDFSLQSTNATVAFVSMLTVAGSGLVGRYLYGQVHRGLYGQRLEARTLREEATGSRDQLVGGLTASERWRAEVEAFENRVLTPTRTLGQAIGRALSVGGVIRRSRKVALTLIDAELGRQADAGRWDARTLKARRGEALQQLGDYYRAVRRAASLGLYERLFSLWHVLHVPLFVILVLTVVIHVIAVHLY